MLGKPRSRYDLHAASDAIAIGFGANGLNANPVLAISAIVSQNYSPLAEIADHDVHIAIVVDVSEGGTAAGPIVLEGRAGSDAHEMAGLVVQQQGWLHVLQVWRGVLNGVHHVALSD